jgi:hypothetical protein
MTCPGLNPTMRPPPCSNPSSHLIVTMKRMVQWRSTVTITQMKITAQYQTTRQMTTTTESTIPSLSTVSATSDIASSYPDGPSAPLNQAQQDNSGNANELLNPQTHHDPVQPHSRWGENGNATGMETTPNQDTTQSSIVDPYPWGEGKFEPTWDTWRTRPATIPDDPSWEETTQRWERNERDKVINRGGSPPPKLDTEPNLFHDDSNQRISRSNRTASEDLAFKTGRRID